MPRNDLKAYTSVIARIPQDLADRLKRYAREHRCAVSELIRDGLEMRLEEGSPWHAPGSRRAPDGEVVPEVLHALEALTPMLRTQLQETVRTTMAEVLQEVIPRETSQHATASEAIHEVSPTDDEVVREVLPPAGEVIPGHTSTPQALSTATNGGMTEVVPGHTEVIPAQPTARTARRSMTEVVPEPDQPAQPSHEGLTEVLPFDPVKHRLGKLCPRGHDYHGTGKSLRTNKKAGYCLACNAATNQRKRDRERQQGVQA